MDFMICTYKIHSYKQNLTYHANFVCPPLLLGRYNRTCPRSLTNNLGLLAFEVEEDMTTCIILFGLKKGRVVCEVSQAGPTPGRFVRTHISVCQPMSRTVSTPV
jgi:hypothetical protein